MIILGRCFLYVRLLSQSYVSLGFASTCEKRRTRAQIQTKGEARCCPRERCLIGVRVGGLSLL